jgi:ABC-2 type transport system permease protein
MTLARAVGMLWDNPVFVKEIRGKMRMRQSRPVRIAVAVMAVLFVLWLYNEAVRMLLYANYTPDTARDMFTMVFVLQAVLLWGTCPSAAANAVSQEREQQTWDLLVCTLLRPHEILAGKLVARMLPALAIMVVFVPFEVLCRSIGGTQVPLGLIVSCGVFLLVSVVFLVTLGLYCSFVFRKTPVAIACAYIVVLILVFGTTMLSVALNGGSGHEWDASPLMWVNPVRVGSAICNTMDQYADYVIPFGLGFYLVVTAFLIWRMVSRFRLFAVQ